MKRGIGIHHGGLLPILKEVIEILFQEGLLKALFSTETFSMGLNMPAKTVVFTSVRKFDGTDFRVVTSGEYIQMSGRAGRRGLDDRGIVIMMVDEELEPVQAKTMIKGESDSLNSSFHLGYNMLLNLLRVEEAGKIRWENECRWKCVDRRYLYDVESWVCACTLYEWMYSYTCIGHLVRIYFPDPEYMMARSFHQFQANRSAPKLQESE